MSAAATLPVDTSVVGLLDNKRWIFFMGNDDDVAQFAQFLSKYSHPIDRLRLKMLPGFTERGAHAVAACLRECNIQSVELQCRDGDQRLISNEIIRILYLEGNKPYLSLRYGESYKYFEFLMLQHNDSRLDSFFLDLDADTDLVLISNALEQNTWLMNLAMKGDVDAVTLESARALARGICRSNVREVDYVVLWESPIQPVPFRQGIQASGRPFELLMCSPRDDTAWTSLMPTLTILAMRSFCALPKACRLWEALELASNLTRLDLSGCKIDNEWLRSLSLGLRNNASIKDLNLGRNNIGDEGIIAFAHNWHPDSPLEYLNLSGNHFAMAGLEHLMRAVLNHPALRILNLERCTSMGFVGLQFIANAMPHLVLHELHLSRCFPASHSLNVQAQLAHQADVATTRQAFLDGVRANSSIMVFNVDPFSVETMNEIEFYLELNLHGRRLWTEWRDVPASVWCNILEKCAKSRFNHSCIFYFLVQQPWLAMAA